MTFSTSTPPEPNATVLGRVHAWLMPDYNRPAAVFWWTIATLGVLCVAWAFGEAAQQGPRWWLQVAGGVALAMLAGIFPVRIPQSKNSFAFGELFIFLLMLTHGPAAAVLAAAAEGAVSAWRTSKRWTSRIISPATAATSMTVFASALHAALPHLQGAVPLLLGVMATSLAYFTLQIFVISALPRLKRNEPMQLSDLFGVFGWVGIAYVGSASLACLLFLVQRQAGEGVLLAMVPLLAMMLATLHYFFRQQEAALAARLSQEEASAREAELAARHMVELQASERRFHSAFTHASIGMALVSMEGRVLQVNEALRQLLGRGDEELLHQPLHRQFEPQDHAALCESLVPQEGRQAPRELRAQRADGSLRWVAVMCSAFSEPGSTSPCLIVQVQDVHARRDAEEGLHRIAFTDALTGLPNRRRFQELLSQAVARARHDAGAAFAVMFIDFDRFKLINDSLGHQTGDEFLIQVGQRIGAQLRRQDTLARLGGDEFAIILRQLQHERDAVRLADRLMEALRQPFMVGGHELMTSASVGITFSALGYTTPEDMLRDADIAMYKAKGAGKARYAVFDASLHQDVARRLRMEGELRHAVDQGQLRVVFQPIFTLDDGEVSGFEALLRWQHPNEGLLGPQSFLPIAEESGMILHLTDFVLHVACRQLAKWQALVGPQRLLSVNVNVSGNDIAHAGLVARVTRALVEAKLRPEQLCVELTENILMSRLEGALPVLQKLRKLGVQLAIDDFGTGYSSLSHLSTLPIDTLKIDRSFVTQLGEGRNEEAVVRSIIALGSSMGKKVVAEGIETEHQQRELTAMGCRMGQGFRLGVPVPPEEVTALLQAGLPSIELLVAAETRSGVDAGLTLH